ncbi:MAG: succinylglutamate-semialdehyde dehydrogenase, partial [Pseudomonadota bacterium]
MSPGDNTMDQTELKPSTKDDAFGRLIIKGTLVAGNGPMIESIDPSTSEVILKTRSANDVDVNAAVREARDAFPAWASTPLDDRIGILTKYADIVRSRSDELARLISRETGKPFWETKTEAAAVANKVDISIRAYEERTGERDTATGPTKGMLRHKPHGVLAVLGPYNFPAHLPNGHVVPALLAGNTVVLKPSELAPMPGEWIARALVEAGVPPGVLGLVHGARETGEALVGNPEIDGVLFTGGAKTGLALHKQFADAPQTILALELGGNNPLVWWDTEDIEAAAFAVVQSAFLTSGQRCTCARRLIVPDDGRGVRYLKALTALVDRIHVAAPFDDPQPFMGPVITSGAANALELAFDRTLEMGGKAIRSLSVQEEGSAFVSPGIVDVTDVTNLPDEEHFGPLLKVIRVASFDEALKTAKATRFGLSAGLLTDDREDWDTFFSHARAGIVNWNRQ